MLAVWNCNAIENELDLEQACLSQMVNLQSALEDTAPIVHEVTTKLGAFASVWAAIAADIRQIAHSSQSCSESETSHVLFTRRVEMLEAMYQCLSDALRYYQVTVRMPDGSAGPDKELGMGFYNMCMWRVFGRTPAKA
ncbi:hypothetical protein PAXRUDRAFT_435043 [Paxillus rubicundulus Ve08.2h10]|uniref:Uncharacterized protein n=1 Tax=Paxillus rubicundulus Ve08.2h10 TaxID=930991 RepID=A0A0D0DQH3_9AGAM|nr:hypothetical protein PAXRUDRAFT_435043 [Paxillus rubicundulus Ve08.2h10]